MVKVEHLAISPAVDCVFVFAHHLRRNSAAGDGFPHESLFGIPTRG